MDNVFMYMCIWPYVLCYKCMPLQFIDSSLVISYILFTNQRESETLKDKRTYYGAMDKS